MTERSGDAIPQDEEWIDVGSGVQVTMPAPMSAPDGSEMLGSWWRHTEPGGKRDALAHMLFGGSFHRLVATDPLTIEPSILCGVAGRPGSGCGRHGYITDGRWHEVKR